MISGLDKFDADLVSKVARATAAGGGTHIDIACDPELVRVAKAVSSVPVSLHWRSVLPLPHHLAEEGSLNRVKALSGCLAEQDIRRNMSLLLSAT